MLQKIKEHIYANVRNVSYCLLTRKTTSRLYRLFIYSWNSYFILLYGVSQKYLINFWPREKVNTFKHFNIFRSGYTPHKVFSWVQELESSSEKTAKKSYKMSCFYLFRKSWTVLRGRTKLSPSSGHNESIVEHTKKAHLLAIRSKDGFKTFASIELWKFRVSLEDFQWHLRMSGGYPIILLDTQERLQEQHKFL